MNDRKNTSVPNILKNINDSIDGMKSVQPIGGAGFVNYNIYSNSQYDFSVSQTGTRMFRLSFIHSVPNKWNIVELSVFHRVNNPDVMGSPEEPNALTRVVAIDEAPQLGVNSWILESSTIGGGSNTFYMKFFFHGTTPGVFNIDPL